MFKITEQLQNDLTATSAFAYPQNLSICYKRSIFLFQTICVFWMLPAQRRPSWIELLFSEESSLNLKWLKETKSFRWKNFMRIYIDSTNIYKGL